MTEPENSPSGTRPISVAELLAKNGTIGAPPVGGRRRRRRGNSDSVTVAELTGEIPIITDDIEPPPRDEPVPRPDPLVDTAVVEPIVDEPRDELREPPRARSGGRNGGPRPQAEARPPRVKPPARPAEPDVVRTDAEDDYDAHLAARDADPEPVEFRPRPRRGQSKRPARDYQPSGTGAERMSPDPLYDLDDDGAAEPADALVEADPRDIGDVHDAYDADSLDDAAYDDYEAGSYSSLGPLFGGESVADDMARRPRGRAEVDDIDLGHDADLAEGAVEADEFGEHDEFDEERPPSSPLVRGLWIVGQCVIAVAFGAGLFIAFDQLWKWNTIVALVLGVLVILGLAGGVRVVRKTEDIGSTLTAVAVGALVTFGPLALLQAG
ncbi:MULTISPECIES: FUSC family protein [unclassified Mycolicibacterium]|uniref:FUSC family protein n=1 Tax=unclassified Mycolicibacterium TaxID=2636767 RepID=UPI0012DCA4FD|nr:MULTISPECIES: FUSC family protein [unclassified Mycolicibacterium]MUL81723.1 FUSC family protein [Mycolicibacterium sp. CBMA 329]MUL87489.1 FUSC family protein [Mycolicibacterium sp. CBMA 331]MUL99646.1 FUSC family protein [Mycolicibacterium sp. CBMA 334]MUM26743.1 FUSC family protein [Mycolicibacterium sp. CBMA 295]MUM37786.1 FUSC family protein [Mycolicibacterium sp. CBMA 247]